MTNLAIPIRSKPNYLPFTQAWIFLPWMKRLVGINEDNRLRESG